MSFIVHHGLLAARSQTKGASSCLGARARLCQQTLHRNLLRNRTASQKRLNGIQIRNASGGAEKNKVAVKYGVRLVGTGSAAPKQVLSNADLEKLVDTNDEWIKSRTGISRRHIAGEGESLSSLASEASVKALEMAGVDAADVDLIVMCTSTPDDLFGCACVVQHNIGAVNAAAFDLTAACSGFVVGLVNVTHLIRGGNFRNVLLIGGDVLSRYVDWRDRATCILFGDGCGAMLLQAKEGECNVLGFDMRSDGSMNKSLVAAYHSNGTGPKPLAEGAASDLGSFENISMTGSDIFKFAVRAVPQIVNGALDAAGLEREHIDWLVLHQANQRIIDSAANRLGIPLESVVSNISEYGNTSAASIPLAFDEVVRSGQVKPGDVVAFAGFGAGLTWASAICKWGEITNK
mmetsp:Transcript_30919/g.42851  ORF Transcript_30919/g.42851 Transcript_30919/m.42851 type:complete len:405 (-) Transcript_30919:109-1323(-)